MNRTRFWIGPDLLLRVGLALRILVSFSSSMLAFSTSSRAGRPPGGWRAWISLVRSSRSVRLLTWSTCLSKVLLGLVELLLGRVLGRLGLLLEAAR